MSMIMVLESLPADAAISKVAAQDAASLAESPEPSIGLFDGDSFDESFDDFDEHDDYTDGFEEASIPFNENSITLEKAWHGLHFLLTGEAWGGDGPRAFLVTGGIEQGEDLGYGAARLFNPSEVAEIASELNEIDGEELWNKFDQHAFTDAEIYPDIWDEDPEDLQAEYLEYFEELKSFVSSVAENRESMRIAMT